jgi:peptidoglycan hydrolase-like protein with peptidoglycan-binding domain
LTFSRSLKRGLRGFDVLQLQRALNSLGFTISKAGPGSIGKETDLFGIATEVAVKRFQEKYKKELLIPLGLKRATGIVALRTQKLLLQLMASE